jgi:hypothetical protein
MANGANKSLIDTSKIITYGSLRSVRILDTLFDEAEKRINSIGEATKTALESREIFNSIFNSLDMSKPNLWNELQTIIALYLQQSRTISLRNRYTCDIRLTSGNEEKYKVLERKAINRYGKDINVAEILFNSVVIMFNNLVQ